MGLRKAFKKLSGRAHSWIDHDVYYGPHIDGYPAVTVKLNGPSRSRTFRDHEQLRRVAMDMLAAARWLQTEGEKT